MILDYYLNWGDLQHFENMPQPLVAKAEQNQYETELPLHSHTKGQLIVVLGGYVTCEVDSNLWMVPTNNAIWIPANTVHTNRTPFHANLCHVYIQPNLQGLPDKPCTLAMSPVIKELIGHFASLNQHYEAHSSTDRIAQVIFDLLLEMPVQSFNFPQSKHALIQLMAKQLWYRPDNRKTLTQWATELAIGERTLARLIKKETGMSFGKWRNQMHIIIALQKLEQKYSVQQISDSLGYDSVSAFITMFKKALGLSPKKYIAQINH